MNTQNDFLDNAVDDELAIDRTEDMNAEMCSYMQSDTEIMCSSLRSNTHRKFCNAFPYKINSIINVKAGFGEGESKVPLGNTANRTKVYKPEERVTYKMIKEHIEAKYGFKVHTAYIAEVKRELGLPMYDAPKVAEELK